MLVRKTNRDTCGKEVTHLWVIPWHSWLLPCGVIAAGQNCARVARMFSSDRKCWGILPHNSFNHHGILRLAGRGSDLRALRKESNLVISWVTISCDLKIPGHPQVIWRATFSSGPFCSSDAHPRKRNGRNRERPSITSCGCGRRPVWGCMCERSQRTLGVLSSGVGHSPVVGAGFFKHRKLPSTNATKILPSAADMPSKTGQAGRSYSASNRPSAPLWTMSLPGPM